jgi:hypothetical protein
MSATLCLNARKHTPKPRGELAHVTSHSPSREVVPAPGARTARRRMQQASSHLGGVLVLLLALVHLCHASFPQLGGLPSNATTLNFTNANVTDVPPAHFAGFPNITNMQVPAVPVSVWRDPLEFSHSPSCVALLCSLCACSFLTGNQLLTIRNASFHNISSSLRTL